MSELLAGLGGAALGGLVAFALLRMRSGARDASAAALRRAERRHRNERRRAQLWEEISDRLSEGIVVVGDLQRPVLVNRAARRLLGMGESLPARVPSREIRALIREVLATGDPLEDVVELWAPERRAVRVTAFRLRTAGGAGVILQDVSAQQQALVMRRQFVANASHELKSPVASIQALSEALSAAATEDPQRARDFGVRLRKEAERLATLVSSLLDLSKLEEPAVLGSTEVDLAEVARAQAEATRPGAEDKGLELVEDIAPAVCVKGDAQHLAVIVRNLLDNATRYTPEGGTVRITVARRDGEALLRVDDTGIGIPLSAQKRIFERFYRVDEARSREHGGTGLGLAIVKHVAEIHGGRVDVESVLGEGSSFTVHLPVSEELRRPAESSA